MKKAYKSIISIALLIIMTFMATIPTFAAKKYYEEYLSDLRLVYAKNLYDAEDILADSGLEGYSVYKENLNAGTGKIGVWLAFKTTTDIDDAITDIAVMQMNGGYREGNYREMIKQSLAEYEKMAETYLVAIDYFREAYESGNYLAEIAHRQLNFYTVVTEGIDEISDFEGELLGDIFIDGVDSGEVATMFMEGNSYALKNIRTLLSMGVSYNADGKTYLEKVAIEAEKYENDKDLYSNEDYSDLATLIAPTLVTFKEMLEELEAHAGDLNYEDEELTDLEIRYLEYKLISEMLGSVNYLGGKTLYDFCLDFTLNQADFSDLYPLVAALNEGQAAMTRFACFYDVFRYSMVMLDNEDINNELDEMEEKYSESPFNIYSGVDRTIYRDTFALTSEAYRADAFTESGLTSHIFNEKLYGLNIAATVVGSVGVACMAYGLGQFGYKLWKVKSAIDAYDLRLEQIYSKVASETFSNANGADTVNYLFRECYKYGHTNAQYQEVANWSFVQKFQYLSANSHKSAVIEEAFEPIKERAFAAQSSDTALKSANDAAYNATEAFKGSGTILKTTFVVGGIMTLISAIKLGISIYNYYHPTYEDIPTALVDLIDTEYGDRYIKYDVVLEAEENEDGTYSAADLNAFSAERWNALYYTKSYEAGKPLLADAFWVSTTKNVPDEKYMAVHRFGEVVCYNLNKYNFDANCSIYLSVKQSDKQKSAVADVPEVVGSIFGNGLWIIAGGVGIVVGVGGFLGTQEIVKLAKAKKEKEKEEASETLNE